MNGCLAHLYGDTVSLFWFGKKVFCKMVWITGYVICVRKSLLKPVRIRKFPWRDNWDLKSCSDGLDFIDCICMDESLLLSMFSLLTVLSLSTRYYIPADASFTKGCIPETRGNRHAPSNSTSIPMKQVLFFLYHRYIFPKDVLPNDLCRCEFVLATAAA